MNMPISPDNDFSLTTSEILLICQALTFAKLTFLNHQEIAESHKILQKFEDLLNEEGRDHFMRWLNDELSTPGGPKEV